MTTIYNKGKHLIILGLAVLIIMSVPIDTKAQWSIGAAFESRNEDPTNGFGVKVERSILNIIPIVDLGLRAHFSYFNEENEFQDGNVTVSREVESYDFGLAATGGVPLGLFTPYVGAGIGSDNFQIENNSEKVLDESNFYWNAFGGAKLTLIPLLTPFVEYRWSRLTGTDDIGFDNFGRVSVGVSLNF